MSQTMKRNAEKAFEPEDLNKSSKKKRVRPNNNTRPVASQEKSGTVSAASVKNATPVKTKSTRTEIQVAEVSKMKSKNAPTVSLAGSKLEYRISAPSTSTDLVQKKGSTKQSKKHKKQQHNTKTIGKRRDVSKNSWSLSTTSGGVFIDHEPILTADGAYLILPTRDTVQIYSTVTSLLVRSIQVREKGIIVGCCLTVDSVILVATKKGAMVKYELATGNKTGEWSTGLTLRSVTAVGGNSYKILATCLIEGQGDQLSLFDLQAGGKFDNTILLQNRRFSNSAAVWSDGPTTVVCEANIVHIASLESDSYKWHQLRIPGVVCSFDIRVTTSKKNNNTVSIAVGLENGSIFLYENVLHKLKSGSDLSSRKLHWHRTQVRSVKWSRDGNYVISGGDETVLVIWQLETNQQQFLPHLSTIVQNIAVSTNGAQYAIQLGDNSVMILDTADLTPSSNVAGLSLSPGHDTTPMQLHPLHSNQLLAAVSIRPSSKDRVPTHLQTYDIDTGSQLSRQALTRNVTTVVNVSPDGVPVIEPTVAHLQVSFDGGWLATVDRWSPHNSDVQAIHLKEEGSVKQDHTETVLRFWLWNAEDNSWEVSARIDEAHVAGRVSILALAANPVAAEFASMGEDGSIKIWRPKRRVRDGVQVRDKAGQALYNWACHRTIQIEASSSTGVLAYSEDGSVVTASWSRRQRHVHVIDPRTGNLCMSSPGLLSEGQASIAMVGRYLLCLSNNFQIFDMITAQIAFAIELDSNQSSFLAVNTRSQTFVLGLNSREKNTATISVFEINDFNRGAIADMKIPAQIRAILPASSDRGFIVVDVECKIRKLVPPGKQSIIAIPDAIEQETRNFEDIFGQEKGGATQKLIESDGSTMQLSALFAVSTSGQPGVGELFSRVSKAFGNAQMIVGA